MILIVHIIVALTSLVTTGFSAFAPTKRRLHVSYGLIGLTLLSGTVLVITTHSPILGACETGLVYLSVALSGVVVTAHRLNKNATS